MSASTRHEVTGERVPGHQVPSDTVRIDALTGLPGTPEQYWRWGLPSLVLALVTLCLWAYSTWVVQSSVRERYAILVSRNFEQAGLEFLGDAERGEGSSAGVASGETSERMFVETQLALKRLIYWAPEDDSLRFASATWAAAFAEWNGLQAVRLAGEPEKVGEVVRYQSMASAESAKAVESMRRVVKMNGPRASAASIWLARNTLDRYDGDAVALLDPVEKSLRDLIAKGDATDQAYWLLTRCLAERAFSLDPAIDRDERMRLLDDAISQIGDREATGLSSIAWRALVAMVNHPDVAQDSAWAAMQEFHGLPAAEKSGGDAIDAMFMASLIWGETREAKDFVQESIAKVAPQDAARVRMAVAATCRRMLVANWLLASEGSAVDGRETDNAGLLDLAIRLNPDSSSLAVTMASITSLGDPASLSEFLGTVLASSDAGELKTLVTSMAAARSPEMATDAAVVERLVMAFGEAARKGPSYAVFATRLAAVLVQDQAIDRQLGITIVDRITENSPSALTAWFVKGTWLMEAKRYGEARACFERLRKQVPDNEQVEQWLNEASEAAKG